MGARQGVRRQPRDPSDFQGDPFLKMRRMAAEAAYLRRRKLAEDAAIATPPPVEDAVLMAADEQIEYRVVGRWVMSPRGGHMKWVEVPFDWRLSDHWSNRNYSEHRDVAAAALMELTPLTASDIADLLGCAAPTVTRAHNRFKSFLLSDDLRFGSQMRLDELIRVMERAEEIAGCALLWIDGVEVRE